MVNGTLEKTGYQQRILVVDDEDRFRASCQELLTLRGFLVTTCSNGTQALKQLQTDTYDAVLLDIQMPGLEGTDLLPMIKRVNPDLPVILVSAYCEDSDASYYQELGAAYYLKKPVTNESLMEALGQAIQQETRIPVVLRSLSMREGREHLYRKLILSALRKTSWNQVKAAELLGVSRYCLMRWMKKLGVVY